MIRFSAFLVVVAVGLLVAGVVTSKLVLVYVAIGVSGVALLALGIGAAVNWRELFGKPKTAASDVGLQDSAPAQTPLAQPALAQTPLAQAAQAQTSRVRPEFQGYPRPAAAGPVWHPAEETASSVPDFLSADQPRRTPPSPPQPAKAPPATPQPAVPQPAAFTPRSGAGYESPAPGVWEWREDLSSPQPPGQPPRPAPASSPDEAPQPAPAQPAALAQPAKAPAPLKAPESTLIFRRLDDATGQPAPKGELGLKDQPGPKDELRLKDQPDPKDQPGPKNQPGAKHQPGTEDKQSPKDSQPAAPSTQQPTQRIPPPASSQAQSAATTIYPPPAEAIAVPAAPVVAPAAPAVPAAPAAPAAGPDLSQASPPPEPAQAPEPAKPEPEGPDPQAVVTVVPGVPRYHNASCILIRFMGENDLEKMTRASAKQNGCTPCRACLPDQPEGTAELAPKPRVAPIPNG